GQAGSYACGRFAGSWTLRSTWLGKSAHGQRFRDFFAHHGPPTILGSRFVPGLRMFAGWAAGLAPMEWQPFLVFNFLGAAQSRPEPRSPCRPRAGATERQCDRAANPALPDRAAGAWRSPLPPRPVRTAERLRRNLPRWILAFCRRRRTSAPAAHGAPTARPGRRAMRPPACPAASACSAGWGWASRTDARARPE